MARTVAVGEQDFSKIVEQDSFYVDKTNFIKEWWDSRDTVTLITRPRRFGKTLTMSMVNYFFSLEYAKSALFNDLAIWKDEKFRHLQGTYPVIFLSFAGIKADHYEEAYYDISRLIAREYRRYAFIMDSSCFLPSDRNQYEKILDGNANHSDLSASLNLLSEYLYDYYKKKVIILLDEYDTPMQEAYVSGYWEKLMGFMRKWMNATFKTNLYLERAILIGTVCPELSGITRISKESVFSDLNNLEVITTTSKKYAQVFGFTEPEVFKALEEFGLQDRKAEVKRWYDGFCMGGHGGIYNPWSVIKFLKEREIAPYWANTSSNKLIANIIGKSDIDIKLMMEDLLLGKSLFTQVDEEVNFGCLDTKKSAVWGLLLASGYLKAVQIVKNRKGKPEYELCLTNREVRCLFDEMVTDWFSNKRLNYSDFSDALLSGDIFHMNEYMNDIAMETFSFFDTGAKSSEWKQPENFYHGFVLGLIADLRELYKVTSNRESGCRRYDVLLEPYQPEVDDGITLEFKVYNPKKEKSLKDTVQTAVRQILDRKYAANLEQKCGRNKIRIYGFAFRGKEVLVDGGYLDEIADAGFFAESLLKM